MPSFSIHLALTVIDESLFSGNCRWSPASFFASSFPRWMQVGPMHEVPEITSGLDVLGDCGSFSLSHMVIMGSSILSMLSKTGHGLMDAAVGLSPISRF
ncbi:hypothetical protein E6O75_ATG00906 [Venturia nashicola]|uniref:Uncharacterized protein n=1 Tax=Venturia nashicola TaxID=86259 RepID=A0A4Z1PCY7_9PEZI|nr:hypothetical protein E6O75_ATG00906 [Venturia nashicola]